MGQWVGVDPYVAYPAAPPDVRYASALARILRFSNRAHLMRMYSGDAATWIQDGSLDLVFVDGLHSYEGVSSDLWSWISKICPDGILAGHDYDAQLPGVPAAVHEFMLQRPPADE